MSPESEFFRERGVFLTCSFLEKNNNIKKRIFYSQYGRRCPTVAITVMKETKEYDLLSLQCLACGYCVAVCPVKCLIMENRYLESVFAREE